MILQGKIHGSYCLYYIHKYIQNILVQKGKFYISYSSCEGLGYWNEEYKQ